MGVTVRFLTLTGNFAFGGETKEFPDLKAAKDAVKAYAASGGYSKVKEVDDFESDEIRFTATTPGGRAGRNIAFCSYGEDFSETV